MAGFYSCRGLHLYTQRYATRFPCLLL